MFHTVLIANRGAIATRIIRTLKKLGIRSVAVYHEADANSLHVQHADVAISLGAGSASDTYLNIDKILQAAKDSGAQAIHPGYGFLSENTHFVRKCAESGVQFIGPTPEQMELFGLKHAARDAAQQAGVPLLPGSPLLTDIADAQRWATDVGFPVMLKSTAGGGGIGMQVCHDVAALNNAWDTVRRLGSNYFANDGVFLEKYIANARHIEVQVFGDGKGAVVSLGERDCSAQRRNQKVLEESPAPHLSDVKRNELHHTAERLMSSVNYRNAGTVEFIFDASADQFYFLEVNTRLQVEHGVTEQVWGVDLVEWMIRLAADDLGDIRQLKSVLKPKGHAIQARIYAEDPHRDFRPSAGLLSHVQWPAITGLRIDHWIESGIEIPALFDPMIAKVIAHGESREQALSILEDALRNSELYGIETNRDYLLSILQSEPCREGRLLTRSLVDITSTPSTVAVLQGGTQTTIQDYPGRVGLWHVGVPPSGPMDALNFRLANQLLGNAEECAALEITLNGPTLQFDCDCSIALTGADIDVQLDDVTIPMYATIVVRAKQKLVLGRISGNGARSYLAVSGGFQCPAYLGSRATFTLGQFGGHSGRALRAGDVLHVLPDQALAKPAAIAPEHRPTITDSWTVRVMYGPHGAPEFFTPADITTFFAHTWEVHYNSSRTGVRLVGPKPTWARETGGEAGLHPSNIHDNAYAFGTVDFTGDLPVILGVDGPSLGGFVCPATVITADLWKLGQLKAGAKVRFVPVTHNASVAIHQQQNAGIKLLRADESAIAISAFAENELTSPIVLRTNIATDDVVCRVAGDNFLLIELGPLELDIKRRFTVHALMLWLQDNLLSGMYELTPGIRSLQIHYNALQLPLATLLQHVTAACAALADEQPQSLPSRTVYLPLSWDDAACRTAIEKYTQSVRPNAPWCPSNLEFIRRINGMADINAVKEVVFNAAYLVLGLGDVYLGAPVATPIDPRHRLVTTKYNPARTWTAENSVGIGGAYMCVYGMEGPGGYQFVGRTAQMWNKYHTNSTFTQPWLLRFFDQIRFYEVSADELQQIRRDFPLGKHTLRIEDTTFSLTDYCHFLVENETSIHAFQQQREVAFNAELEEWRRTGQLTYQSDDLIIDNAEEEMLPNGITTLDSPVSGSVWSLSVKEGQQIQAGDTLMVLESMKMEIELHATHAATVQKILREQGQSVSSGQALLWLKTE